MEDASGAPTIKDVSVLAQVSPATVSRVLNGTARVNEATRSRVIAAVETLGYRPNAFARALATNRSGGIGITVNEVASPYFGAFIKGVEEEARAEGIHLMVSSGYATAALEKDSIEFLISRRCDGLVVQAEGLSDDYLIDLVRRGSPAVVVFGRRVPQIEEACVYTDNVFGGELATRHLVEHGHRHVGHISGPLSWPDARDRLAGYRRALESADLGYQERYVVESTFYEEGGAAAARDLLARAPELSAIFVANDQMAAGAMRVIRDHGKTIPHDISVVGYDDVYLARYLTPELTTIRQPLLEMGRRAAHLLLRLPDDNERGEVVHRFVPELVERQSVTKLAA